MAITFFEEITFDKLQVYLADYFMVPVLPILLGDDILPIRKEKIASWSDLGNLISQESMSFFDVDESFESVLVDYSDLDLNLKSINYLKSLEAQNIFLYSSISQIFSSDNLKEIKKNGFNIQNLKKVDANRQKEIAVDYRNQIQLMINEARLGQVVNQSATYIEIINALDYIKLSDNYDEAVNSLIIPSKPELFMMGFDNRNLINWLRYVNEDEIQLASSLIHTKLSKNLTPKNQKLIKLLIESDYNSKNNSRVSSLTYWKLFLWNASLI